MPLLKRLSDSKLYLIPGSVTLTGNMNRSWSFRITKNVRDSLSSTLRRDFRGGVKVSYKVFDNLTTTYAMDTKRDLSDPETIIFSFDPKKFKLGRETNFSQTFGASYGPDIFSFLTHRFTFNSSYREDLNVTNGTRNASSNKSYSINGNFDFKKLLGSESGKKRQRRVQTDEDKVVVAEGGKNPLFFILEPPLKLLRFLTGWIEPIKYDYKEAYNYSYIGLLERAQLKFRFGLTEDIGAEIDTVQGGTIRSNAITKRTAYSLGSGTTLLSGLKVGVGFSRSINEDIEKSANPQKSIQTTFPDFSFTIGQLKYLTFLNPLIKKFSPRTKFTRSKSETYNLATTYKTAEKVSISQSPLLSFNVPIMRGLQLNFSTDRTVSEDRSYSSETGELNSISKSTRRGASFGTKYSFTWPTGFKIPILGRIRFKSTMSMSVDVTTSSTKTERADSDGILSSPGTRSDLVISPSLSYTFSNQIKGGLTARWQDTDNRQEKIKRHVRELRIWVEIRF